MELLPQSIKLFKKNSVFVKILLSFIAIIFFATLAVGYSSYTASSRILLEEVKNSRMISLKQTREIVDQHVAILDKLSLQVAGDKMIRKALYIGKENSPADVYFFSDIITQLKNIKATFEYVESVAVSFSKSECVVIDHGKYDFKYFFDEVRKYDGTDDEKWKKTLSQYSPFKDLGKNRISIQSLDKKNVISFIRSLPINEDKPYGAVIIGINETVFKNIIGEVNQKTPAYTYIMDESGKIITGNSSAVSFRDEALREMFGRGVFTSAQREFFLDEKLQGEDYTLAVAVSSLNGWKYIAVIPTHNINYNSEIIKKVTIFIGAVCIILGFILAFVLSNFIYNPINKIISYIEIMKGSPAKDGKNKDELGLISRIIDVIYNENTYLRESFNSNIPRLREKFLNDLLDGRCELEKSKDILENLLLNMDYPMFQVAVFKIDYENDPVQHTFNRSIPPIEEEIDTYFLEHQSGHMRSFSVKKGYGTVVTLINLNLEETSCVTTIESVKMIVESVYNTFGVSLTAGLGNIYKHSKDIHSSFIESLFALKYEIIKGQRTVIPIDEVKGMPEVIFEYPVETEKQMINMVKSGDFGIVKKTLDSVFEENLSREDKSPEMIINLLNALASTAIRTIYDIQASVEEVFGSSINFYEELESKSQIGRKQAYVIEIFQRITDFIGQKKTVQYDGIYNKIVQMIAEKYHEGVTLNEIGDRLGFSPSYLSWIFKDISGVHFVDYLNAFRIQKAKTLLKDKRLSVMKIGEMTGFNNTHTFIRVFKKHEGVTPGQFRENQ